MIQTSENDLISYRLYTYHVCESFVFESATESSISQNNATESCFIAMFEGSLLAVLPIYECSGIVLYLLHAAIRVKVTEPGPHLEATDQQKLMVAGSPKNAHIFT